MLRLLVSKLVVDPKLSFRGEGDGTPIEKQSDLLLEVFYKSIVDATAPITLIGTPKDLNESLEFLNEKIASLESDSAKKEKSKVSPNGLNLKMVRLKRYNSFLSLKQTVNYRQSGYVQMRTSISKCPLTDWC